MRLRSAALAILLAILPGCFGESVTNQASSPAMPRAFDAAGSYVASIAGTEGWGVLHFNVPAEQWDREGDAFELTVKGSFAANGSVAVVTAIFVVDESDSLHMFGTIAGDRWTFSRRDVRSYDVELLAVLAVSNASDPVQLALVVGEPGSTPEALAAPMFFSGTGAAVSLYHEEGDELTFFGVDVNDSREPRPAGNKGAGELEISSARELQGPGIHILSVSASPSAGRAGEWIFTSEIDGDRREQRLLLPLPEAGAVRLSAGGQGYSARDQLRLRDEIGGVGGVIDIRALSLPWNASYFGYDLPRFFEGTLVN